MSGPSLQLWLTLRAYVSRMRDSGIGLHGNVEADVPQLEAPLDLDDRCGGSSIPHFPYAHLQYHDPLARQRSIWHGIEGGKAKLGVFGATRSECACAFRFLVNC